MTGDSPTLSDADSQRMIWSGFFPELTDETVEKIIEDHAERTARFPGGDSWQLSWLATEVQSARASVRSERATRHLLQDALEVLCDAMADGTPTTEAFIAARAVLGASQEETE